MIASTSRFAESNDKTTSSTGTTPPTTGTASDTVDTTASHAQYVATAGLRVAGASVSGTLRYRTFNSHWYLTPAARVSYDRGIVSATAYAEQQEADSTFRGDVSARVRLLPFLSVGGSLGQTRPIEGSDRPTSLAYRGEVGLRVGRLWATGGIMSLDTTVVPPPRVYDTLYVAATVGPRQAYFATLRGPIWKGIGVDVVGSKWSWTNSADSSYVPLYQVRSSIYASTSWLSRFPQGNFHVLLRATHEYRTRVMFPVSEGDPQFSSQYRVISTLFELRLYDATVSWQYRNVIGAIYSVVPGYTAPRAINYYGVRWDFFN
jgi:hypothetical protein